MINGYEIKNEFGKEILYLYLDLNDEFANLKSKKSKEKLENIIIDFIKDNKIAFTGTIVSLIVGGTLVGNVLLNNDKKSINNIDYIVMEEKLENINIPEEIKTEENVEEISKPKIINTTQSNKKVETKQAQEKVLEEPKVENTTSDVKEEVKEESKVEEVDNNIYVNVKRKTGETIKLELEEYIIGVVSAEMPAEFNPEALKSQAVIARTYALNSIEKGKTLTDNESTQSYKSNDELKSIWGSSYDKYYNKIKNAVQSTQGLYLTYNGKYIDAVYHSTSNGKTEDSTSVWGNFYPYLVSVDSTYDNQNPSYEKQKSFTYEEISSKLGIEINQYTEFNILSKTKSNRVESISIEDKTYKGTELRSLLGLRSTDFSIEKSDEGITFTTRGYGHGVGMSQYGANGMAKVGYTYSDILKHYYTGVSINHL